MGYIGHRGQIAYRTESSTYSQLSVSNVISDQSWQGTRILHSPWRKERIAANLSFNVELTFAMLSKETTVNQSPTATQENQSTHPRQIYAPRLQVQIHEIKRDPRLQIPMNPRNHDLVPHVHDPDIR